MIIGSYWLHEFIALRTVYRQDFWASLCKHWLLSQLYGFFIFVGLLLAAAFTVFLL